jgi:hypothetical protein
LGAEEAFIVAPVTIASHDLRRRQDGQRYRSRRTHQSSQLETFGEPPQPHSSTS